MRPLYGDNIDDVQQIKELIAENQRLCTEGGIMLEALVYIEDLLSRRPFSSELWPSGEHPQVVIDKIRNAITVSGTRPAQTRRELEQDAGPDHIPYCPPVDRGQ